MQIVYIEWNDASTTTGWHIAEKNEVTAVRTIGLLVNKTKDTVTITSSQSANNRFLDQLNIPASLISKYQVLKKLSK